MEINRDAFRTAALMIALAAQAGGGCVVHHRQVNVREETTSWTGEAPRPVTPSPVYEGYGPAYEGYAPVNEYGPVYEGYAPVNEYGPTEEGYAPVNEYAPIYE